MPDNTTQTISIPPLAQITTLTLVADDDTFVVGSPHTAAYVEVPELGAKIIEWLQRGLDVPECERRAAELAGEPVDVVDFLTVLTDEGLLAETDPGDAVDGDGAAGARDGQLAGTVLQRAGSLLFNRAAWLTYALIALAAPVLLITMPQLRPSYRDGFRFSTQLLNILGIACWEWRRSPSTKGRTSSRPQRTACPAGCP